jgi:hypothetical protein
MMWWWLVVDMLDVKLLSQLHGWEQELSYLR